MRAKSEYPTRHGDQHNPDGSDPLSGFIRYDFENVGDWLDVAATGIGPSGYVDFFDVNAADNQENTNDAVSWPFGGFGIKATYSGDGATLTGQTIEVSAGEASSLVGQYLKVDSSGGPGGTIIGQQVDLTVGDAMFGAASYGEIVGGDGSSVISYNINASVSGSSGAARVINASATATDDSEATGAQLSASAVDADGVGGRFTGTTSGTGDAYGLLANALAGGSGTPYGIWSDAGHIHLRLDTGQTFTIVDASGNPKLQWTEGSPNLHIASGGTVIADL